MPPVVAAVAPFVPSLLGAGAAVYTGAEAAKAQKKAAKRALAQQERQTRVAREESEAALRSLGELTRAGPGGPMYRFREREEAAALEAQMRAAGTWKSGRALEARERIAGRLTAEETEAHTARLRSLAGMAPGAAPTEPYYQAAAGERLGAGVIGRQISGLAGTWEERRRREEERRRLEEEERRRRGYGPGTVGATAGAGARGGVDLY